MSDLVLAYAFWMETWLEAEGIDYLGDRENFVESTRAAIDKHYEGGCAAFEEDFAIDDEPSTCPKCDGSYRIKAGMYVDLYTCNDCGYETRDPDEPAT